MRETVCITGDGEQADAVPGTGGHDDEVGGVPVDHVGTSFPSRLHPSPACWACIVMPSSSQRPLSSVKAKRGDRLAAGDPRRYSALALSSPEASRAFAASATVEKYGAHSSERPISSSTTTSSTYPKPGPAVLLRDRQGPASRAGSPFATTRPGRNPPWSPSAGAPRCSGDLSSRNRRTAVRSSSCSSENREVHNASHGWPGYGGTLVWTGPAATGELTAQDRRARPPRRTVHYEDSQVEIHKPWWDRWTTTSISSAASRRVNRCSSTPPTSTSKLLELCQRPRRTPGPRDPRPLGPHPGRPAATGCRLRRGVTAADAAMLPSYDFVLEDARSSASDGWRLHTIATPGHTPGSMCFLHRGLAGALQRRHAVPGWSRQHEVRARQTSRPSSSRSTAPVRCLARPTIVMPGHGADTTIGTERPHLDEWAGRGLVATAKLARYSARKAPAVGVCAATIPGAAVNTMPATMRASSPTTRVVRGITTTGTTPIDPANP